MHRRKSYTSVGGKLASCSSVSAGQVSLIGHSFGATTVFSASTSIEMNECELISSSQLGVSLMMDLWPLPVSKQKIKLERG